MSIEKAAEHRRSWSDLSKSEARDVFDSYVAGHQARLAEFFDEVRRRGGPVHAMDFSRESLRVLWDWVLTAEAPRRASDDEMRASDPPWWYDFHAVLGQRIGPDVARLVTLIAAYVSETIMRRRPGSTWALGADSRMADFNQPLLSVAGRGQFPPDIILLTFATQWAEGIIVTPDRLIQMYDTRAGSDDQATTIEALSATPATQLPPYTVDRGLEGQFETGIWFDEIVAHDEEARIERLIEALGREPGIERAAHEDREYALVRAPSLDDQTLRAIIDRLWERSGLVN